MSLRREKRVVTRRAAAVRLEAVLESGLRERYRSEKLEPAVAALPAHVQRAFAVLPPQTWRPLRLGPGAFDTDAGVEAVSSPPPGPSGDAEEKRAGPASRRGVGVSRITRARIACVAVVVAVAVGVAVAVAALTIGSEADDDALLHTPPMPLRPPAMPPMVPMPHIPPPPLPPPPLPPPLPPPPLPPPPPRHTARHAASTSPPRRAAVAAPPQPSHHHR